MNGSTRHFNALIERYRNKWHNTIFLVVKDKDIAEDLLQDAILKMYNALSEKTYKDDNKFASWGVRICKNIAIDYLRRKKAKFTDNENFEMKDFHINSLDSIISSEDSRMIQNAIDLLPEFQKNVVILRYFEDLSFKEIAKATGVSVNTALGRMRYAIINLRKIISSKI